MRIIFNLYKYLVSDCNLFYFFFLDYPLVGVEQEAYWVTGWGIHMPWIGLDQQGCGYLKHNCTAETVTDVQKFSYPINIMKEYPRVSLKLKRRNHLQSL